MLELILALLIDMRLYLSVGETLVFGIEIEVFVLKRKALCVPGWWRYDIRTVFRSDWRVSASLKISSQSKFSFHVRERGR